MQFISLITKVYHHTAMPFFGNSFSPKKTPPRKAASLSNLHTLDFAARATEFGLEYGPPELVIATQQFSFKEGHWVNEGTGSSAEGTTREVQRLKKQNRRLVQENNLLRLKVEILLDMCDEAESSCMDQESETRKGSGRKKRYKN
uniref:protein chibby homolog 1 isoform X1 n=2 Tax=Myxine glutinosa TaxID=7769 RepID=UPI00358E0C93